MNGNGYYPFSIRQGSKADFRVAWIMRLVQTALATITTAAVMWFGKLILVAVVYLVNTLPPMQADVSTLKQDVKILKDNAATKAELVATEERVQAAFSKRLDEQIKAAKLQTGGALKGGRP